MRRQFRKTSILLFSSIIIFLFLFSAGVEAISFSTGCDAGNPSINTITLSWSAGSPPYNVFRNSVLIASNVASNFYIDQNLANSTTYSYVISQASGISPIDSGSMTTGVCPPPPTIQTSTIDVGQNPVTGGSWTINQGGYTGVSNTVTPASGGTQYCITSNTQPSGYTLRNISNSVTGWSNCFTAFPGKSYFFYINYQPTTSGTGGSFSVFVSDDAGGQSSSGTMGGSATRIPTISTTGRNVAFDFSPDFSVQDTDWRCNGFFSAVSPGTPSDATSTLPSLGCVQNPINNAFWQTTISDNTNYDFRTTISHNNGNLQQYLSATVRINALPKPTITVTQFPVSGGAWTINPGGYAGASNSVKPSPGGTQYCLTSSTQPSGYTLSNISNSVSGWNNCFTAFPGGNYFFYINYQSSAPICGNGITTSPEQCDAGTQNGVACTPSYGSSCNYCSSQCKTVTTKGPYCGDGICNGAESSTSCSIDCSKPTNNTSNNSTNNTNYIDSCGEITKSGNYKLKNNLVSSKGCLEIHDVTNVYLDCQGYSITIDSSVMGDSPVIIRNVDNFSLESCNIASITHEGFFSPPPLDISTSKNGKIKNNNIAGYYVSVESSSNLLISNNNFNSIYQQRNSFGNSIENNNFNPVGLGYLDPRQISGVILSDHGKNNKIIGNTINGTSDGILINGKGADDGIILFDEDNDVIENNYIENNWDCGIETLGFISNTKIINNTIKNSGFCGIGAWYWNS